MFQRLTNLLFGEVEEVAADLNGPKPCVTEADEEGWMIVNLPGKSDPFKDSGGIRGWLLVVVMGARWESSRDIVQMHPYCQTHNTVLYENAHFLPLCHNLGCDKASFLG